MPSGVLTFVNCYEVKWATFVQDFFTYAKLTALAAIIIAGFVQLGRGKVEYFTWDNTETDVTKIALSFYSGLFAYNGKCIKMCQNLSEYVKKDQRLWKSVKSGQEGSKLFKNP